MKAEKGKPEEVSNDSKQSNNDIITKKESIRSDYRFNYRNEKEKQGESYFILRLRHSRI